MGPAAAGRLPLHCHSLAHTCSDKEAQGFVECALAPSERKESAARPSTAPQLTGGAGHRNTSRSAVGLQALRQAALLSGFNSKWRRSLGKGGSPNKATRRMKELGPSQRCARLTSLVSGLWGCVGWSERSRSALPAAVPARWLGVTAHLCPQSCCRTSQPPAPPAAGWAGWVLHRWLPPPLESARCHAAARCPEGGTLCLCRLHSPPRRRRRHCWGCAAGGRQRRPGVCGWPAGRLGRAWHASPAVRERQLGVC